jgi:hypothetical protein
VANKSQWVAINIVPVIAWCGSLLDGAADLIELLYVHIVYIPGFSCVIWAFEVFLILSESGSLLGLTLSSRVFQSTSDPDHIKAAKCWKEAWWRYLRHLSEVQKNLENMIPLINQLTHPFHLPHFLAQLLHSLMNNSTFQRVHSPSI